MSSTPKLSRRERRLQRWDQRGRSRVPDFLESWSRRTFYSIAFLLLALIGGLTVLWWPAAFFAIPVLLLTFIGIRDIRQSRHAILRNFPLLGHFRFFAESIRPELRQYFVESDWEENPFSREMRSIVYQRAKNVLDTVPFGTKRLVNQVGYEWIAHSLEPQHASPESARVLIGEERCSQPYSSSVFNISAMSFGSLSFKAILALNEGAKLGDFSHNTGEGGVSPYHQKNGGDLVWQIGTGYFGCRSKDGGFDPEKFAEQAALSSIKMIEIKLSQGAKPAHGGILPGDKVTEEIAKIRGVEVGVTVASPPAHSAFSGPHGLLEFVTRLRELSKGKPVGFKICIGQRPQFLAIVKAMIETGMGPDFITVDGGEGGTGAAPIEFSNSVGMPLTDGLTFVNNALIGAGLRETIKIASAGKIATGFHVARQLALGADFCNSARGMMFALGCIQALKCNSNKCPVGVATQNPKLTAGLIVSDKAARVASFHKKTVDALLELVGAAGLTDPDDLRPHHVFRRVSTDRVEHLGHIYPTLPSSCLVHGDAPEPFARDWALARPDSFSNAANGSLV